jgi:hypothetical protein
MSWIKMPLKYDGKCVVCNLMVKKNEVGFGLGALELNMKNVQKKI